MSRWKFLTNALVSDPPVAGNAVMELSSFVTCAEMVTISALMSATLLLEGVQIPDATKDKASRKVEEI